MCAQLVEQRTGNAEVTGSNPVEALIFFRLLLSNCLNWKIYCDDLSLLSVFFFVAIGLKTPKLVCPLHCLHDFFLYYYLSLTSKKSGW